LVINKCNIIRPQVWETEVIHRGPDGLRIAKASPKSKSKHRSSFEFTKNGKRL